MTETEKIEMLMRPRYKIIAGWPICGKHNPENQPKIGSVYYCDSHDMISTEHWIIKNVGNYPHLFRKLEWWEERTVEEMPGYVKWEKHYDLRWSVEKVTKWGLRGKVWYADVPLRVNAVQADCFLPATESEYLAYTQSPTPAQ